MKRLKYLLLVFVVLPICVFGQGMMDDGQGVSSDDIVDNLGDLELIQNCSSAGGKVVYDDNMNYDSCEYGGVIYDDSEVIPYGGSYIFCKQDKQYIENGILTCCPGLVVPSSENPGQESCIVNNEGDMGINMNADCLINGQCSYNIYETLGIRKSDPDPEVSTFVQDIVLAVTTFIGTVVAIILVTSGILYIIASIRGSSSLADMAKKGIIGSIVGLTLVASSYAIVRLIQFFATAGGG